LNSQLGRKKMVSDEMVKVKFFGKFADSHGTELLLENAKGKTIQELLIELNVEGAYMLAVNGALVSCNVTLEDGDELAVMPPVEVDRLEKAIITKDPLAVPTMEDPNMGSFIVFKER